MSQIGVFCQISGILLGTFSRMESRGLHPTVEEQLLRMIRPELPVAKTFQIGHGSDSRCLMIGDHIRIHQALQEQKPPA